MQPPTRTFRLFVSSTFSDFGPERDALQTHVFPELRKLCAENGCRFLAVDLRWGVTAEAHLDQQSVRICLEELNRCQMVTPRPNFLVMLGHRYGWRPLPYTLDEDAFEEALRRATTKRERRLLQRWYKLDRNAVPPVFDLQGRKGPAVEESRWLKIEHILRNAIESAAAETRLKALHPYTWLPSITEQEVDHAVFGPVRQSDHVVAVVRTIVAPDAEGGSSIESLEAKGRAAALIDIDADGKVVQRSAEKQRKLRRQVARHVHRRHEYTTHLQHAGLSREYLPELCDDVLADLSEIIESQIRRLERLGELKEEIEQHERYAAVNAPSLMGRQRELRAITTYVDGRKSGPLLLRGTSGSGKTTLMARAVQDALERTPGAVVVTRFVGATPDSRNERTLLTGLCQEIRRRYRRRAPLELGSIPELVTTFLRCLQFGSPEKPLILFIDAIEQLETASAMDDLRWIADPLPAGARVIVSGTPGPRLMAIRRRLSPRARIVELGPLPMRDGARLLRLWLKEAGRRLQGRQRDVVLRGFERSGLPLYLRMASREAIRWKSYDRTVRLGNNVPALVRGLFGRLGSVHGERLVNRGLAAIAAARVGLAEDELIDVLSADRDVLREFHRLSLSEPGVDRLPAVVWSRLFFDLKPYLSETGQRDAPLLTFWHRQVREVAQEDYVSRSVHRRLAAYFDEPGRGWRTAENVLDVRKIVELPYQFVRAGMWDDAGRVLSEFEFLEAKCAQDSVFGLEDDYRLALERWPKRRPGKALVEAFSHQLQAQGHHIMRHPELLFPQLYNNLYWQDSAGEASETDAIRSRCQEQCHSRRDWLRLRQDPRPLPSSTRIFGGHTDSVDTVALSKDGKYIVSGSRDGTVRVWDRRIGALQRTLTGHSRDVTSVVVSADGTIVSGSLDGTVKIWDLASGRLIRSLAGHDDGVVAVAISRDGERIFSGSFDATIGIWDARSGRRLQVFEAHPGGVLSLFVSNDGSLLASGGRDRAIKVWSVLDSKLLRTLEGHQDAVSAVALTSDGAILVSGSHDNSVRVWDWRRERQLRTTESGWSVGHCESVACLEITPDDKYVVSGGRDARVVAAELSTGKILRMLFAPDERFGFIKSLALTPDGSQIIAGCYDHKIHIWGRSDRILRSLGGHEHAVDALGISADGSRVVSGARDGFVRVWDFHSGRLLRELKSLSADVQALALSPDGMLVFAAIDSPYVEDGTIQVWELPTGKEVRTLEGHERSVNDMALTVDGKHLVSGSWDSTIKVWDVQSGECIRTFEGHDNGVECVKVTPDGTKLVSGSVDGTIRIWALNSGALLRTRKAHPDGVRALAITPDGRRLFSAGGWHETGVSVWRLSDMRLLKEHTLHAQSLTSLAVTSDGDKLVTSSWDGTAKVWRLPRLRLEHRFDEDPKGVMAICATPDGRHVCCGRVDGSVTVRSLDEVIARRAVEGHLSAVRALVFTPDGSRIVSSSEAGKITVWDVETGLEHRSLESGARQVQAIAMADDGRTLVSGSDSSLYVWDIATGSRLDEVGWHDNTVCEVAIVGDRLASGALDTMVRTVDLRTGFIEREFNSRAGEVYCVALTPDGGQVIAGFSGRPLVKVWDVSSGRLRCRMQGHSGAVLTLAVTPDGASVVSGASDGNIHLWDIRPGSRRRLRQILSGHDDGVTGVAIDAQGQRFVSASEDGTLRVWQLANGAARVLYADDTPLTAVALSRDNRYVACGDESGRVLIFDWM